MEVWASIAGYPDYCVSNMGRVKSLKFSRETILRNRMIKRRGHRRYMVSLSNADGRKNKYVHALVCRAFSGPPPSPNHRTAHNDGDGTNNMWLNLRWATQKENLADAILHGTMRGPKRVAEDDAPPTQRRRGKSAITSRIDEIRALRLSGMTYADIGKQLGYTGHYMSMVVRGYLDQKEQNHGH